MSFFSEYKDLLCENLNNRKNIALLAGSFKPPHKGHYEMVKHYSELVGQNGNVVVFISKPSPKSERVAANGKPISAETAKKIFELYCSDLDNVSFEIAPISPVKSCYDFPERLRGEEVTLIFGCSDKGEDLNRWNRVKEYIEQHYDNVYVMNPQTTAVPATIDDGGTVSASQFRNSFGDIEKMITFMPDHVNLGTKKKIAQMLLA